MPSRGGILHLITCLLVLFTTKLILRAHLKKPALDVLVLDDAISLLLISLAKACRNPVPRYHGSSKCSGVYKIIAE
jgi:multisubunit Na+/H+ antiporter MnhC subunit